MAILQRPSLVYPGTPPGIDWSHPAARGCAFSAVSLGGSGAVLDLTTGKPGTLAAGAVGQTNQFTGPSLFYNNLSTTTTFPGKPTAALSSFTIAAIFTYQAGVNNFLFGSSSDSINNGIGDFSALTSQFRTNIGGVANFNIGISPVAGAPYFLAFTGFNEAVSWLGTYFILRLDTGAIASGTLSPGGSGVAPVSNGIYCYGNRTGGFSTTSSLSALMFSPNVALPQAIFFQWAARGVFSFWYPYAGTMRPAWFSQGASGGGGFVPAWAIPSNQIPSGGYAT